MSKIKIGRVVKLDVSTYTVGQSEYKEYTLNDPQFEKEVAATYPSYRIMLPGYVHTMEYRMGRTNIHINKDGMITDITKG